MKKKLVFYFDIKRIMGESKTAIFEKETDLDLPTGTTYYPNVDNRVIHGTLGTYDFSEADNVLTGRITGEKQFSDLNDGEEEKFREGMKKAGWVQLA